MDDDDGGDDDDRRKRLLESPVWRMHRLAVHLTPSCTWADAGFLKGGGNLGLHAKMWGIFGSNVKRLHSGGIRGGIRPP